MKIPLVSRCGYFLLIMLFLVSCGVPFALTVSPTETPVFVTSTTSPTKVPRPTSSPELPTDTPMPSPVPPTRTPRPTPAPTMTADEEYAFVSEMLQNNGGCQLPCWWGFTPGETSWQTAHTFFSSRGKKIWHYRQTGYTVIFDIPQHNIGCVQSYFVEGETIDIINVQAMLPVRDNEFVYGDAQFAKDWAHYMLSPVLMTYGQPSQILVGVYKAPWMPFDLLIFYPGNGILIRYTAPAEQGEGSFRMCPHRTEITLWLWSPERDIALEHIVNMGSPTGDMSYFRPIEEATGMSIEQFYQTFSQPDNQTCLETPVDLW